MTDTEPFVKPTLDELAPPPPSPKQVGRALGLSVLPPLVRWGYTERIELDAPRRKR